MTAPYWLTPEFAGFRKAIRDRPDDDLPRLVLADWLEERGGAEAECGRCMGSGVIPRETRRDLVHTIAKMIADCPHCTDGRVSDGAAARAEFIRVQCELDRMETPAGGAHFNMLKYPQSDYRHGQCVLCDKATAMGVRKRDLLESIAADLPRWPLPNRNDAIYTFDHGFLSNVRGPLAQLRTHLPAILLREPLAEPRVVGSPCKQCETVRESEYGRRLSLDGARGCSHCNGTGSVGRVVGVEVTDRSPIINWDYRGTFSVWTWCGPDDDGALPQSDLPPELYDQCGENYPTELDARLALSRAVWREALGKAEAAQ